MRDKSLLSDKQWDKIKPLLPKPARRRQRGRPRREERLVLEGILWVLRSGARWRDLPKEYPSASTCWRRLGQWEKGDVWLKIWRGLLGQLDAQGKLNSRRSISRRQLRQRQKRGLCVGKTKRGKGTKWMVVADGQGIPLGSQLASATPAEVTLAESTLARISVPRAGRGRPISRPLRVIADRAYDSDPLRWRLLQRGIVLLCPHRRGRRRTSLNDGRTLRRYTKRWKIERTFAHLGNFRRLLIRHERLLCLYQGFFHLACLILTLRHF